mgnify:FL=1
MWKAIDVPQYVADEFNQPMRHPSQNPGAIGRSVERVFRLVGEALEGIQGLGWEINETPSHSVERLEPYGFEWAGNKFIIYAEQRGQKNALAIFKDCHLAADYFVWLVSDGARKINWKLFLDVVP